MSLKDKLKGFAFGLGVGATALYINTHPLNDDIDCKPGYSYVNTNGPNAWIDQCLIDNGTNPSKNKKVGKKHNVGIKKLNVSQYNLSSKFSNFGRVERVSRIESVYHAVEKKYGIPKNTLGAICMMESYGGGAMLNVGRGNKSDGGAGWCHQQPGIAKHYAKNAGIDFKIYDNANSTGTDYKHGSSLKNKFKSVGYNYDKMATFDSRFDPYKNLIVAAEILKEGKRKSGSWDGAIKHYRGGRLKKTGINYLKKVNEYKGMLSSSYKKKVISNFDKRNGSGSYNKYNSYWDGYFGKYIPFNIALK